jgi:hypothetical protein
MGERSDYFEDFPQEDLGNHDQREADAPERRSGSNGERRRFANHILDAVLRLKGVSPVTKPSNMAKS